MHEGQAGFRVKRGCVDNVYTLNELMQGRLKETCILSRCAEGIIMIVCGITACGVRGKMWRVIKRMYESAILLDGERSEAFDVEQGVAQGCIQLITNFVFHVYQCVVREVEEGVGIGIDLNSGGGLEEFCLQMTSLVKGSVTEAHRCGACLQSEMEAKG